MSLWQLFPLLLPIYLLGLPRPVEGQCTTTVAGCPNPNVKFYLSTRLVDMRLVDYNQSGVASAPFSNTDPLEVIIHGMRGSAFSTPGSVLRPKFLAVGQYNILSVDYAPLVTDMLPCYLFAASSTPGLGSCVAGILKMIYAAFSGITPAKTHIIGFSLGAQVAGATARALFGPRVARITALDAAGPLFETPPVFAKLKATDADYVDVFHTNAGLLGHTAPAGTTDVYVNNGYNQPGCPGFTGSGIFFQLAILDQFFSFNCSHFRSIEVFASTINPNPTGLLGTLCIFNPLGSLLGMSFCGQVPLGPTCRFGEFAPTICSGTYTAPYP